jgi:hypothetical protein
MNRRDLIKRLPTVPLAIGAAISQGPALAKTLIGQPGYALQPVGAQAEIALETRVGWFEESWTWLQASSYVPTLPRLAAQAPMVVADDVRAVMQWQQYADQIIGSARSAGIPIELAEKITGITLT